MTQKSIGRQKRDQVAKQMAEQNLPNPYDELNTLYASQMAMFPQYYNMAKIVSNPEVSGFFGDIFKVTNLMKVFSADVMDLHARTQAHFALHGHIARMPDPANEDENMNIIQLFEQYTAFYGVHSQTLLPVMMELDELVQAALRLKSDIQAAEIAKQAVNTAAADLAALTPVDAPASVH